MVFGDLGSLQPLFINELALPLREKSGHKQKRGFMELHVGMQALQNDSTAALGVQRMGPTTISLPRR